MKKKTNRFLWLSLVGILALCVGVFTWMTRFMLRESDRTINEVGGIYMEEMNRQITGRIADWHFAPTQKARANLLAENCRPDHIFVTGNTVIDAKWRVSSGAHLRKISRNMTESL